MVLKDEVNSDRRVSGIPIDGNPSLTNGLMVFDSTTSHFKYIPIPNTIPAGTANGDIIYWNGAVWTLLPKGTANQVLQTGTPPSWVTRLAMTAGVASGDIIYFDGTNWIVLPKGTAGQVLQTGTPPSWVTKLAMTAGVASGDILYFDGTNWVVLPKGTAGQTLITGTPPAWATKLYMTAGVASGDTLYFDGTNWVILSKGTAGQLLQTGTPPSWVTPSTSAWTQLGETILGVAGDKITVIFSSTKKWIKVKAWVSPTGGNARPNIRMGNGSEDTGNNYANRNSNNGGADATNTSLDFINPHNLAIATPQYIEFEMENLGADDKLVNGHMTCQLTAGAGTAPTRVEFVGKWTNAGQADRVIIYNDEAGDFAIGAICTVWGSD